MLDLLRCAFPDRSHHRAAGSRRQARRSNLQTPAGMAAGLPKTPDSRMLSRSLIGICIAVERDDRGRSRIVCFALVIGRFRTQHS